MISKKSQKFEILVESGQITVKKFQWEVNFSLNHQKGQEINERSQEILLYYMDILKYFLYFMFTYG